MHAPDRRLAGGHGGSGRAYRHPVPAPPGGFPLDTGGIQAWASPAVIPSVQTRV